MSRFRLAAAITAGCFVPAPASAAIVQIDISGHVVSAWEGFWLGRSESVPGWQDEYAGLEPRLTQFAGISVGDEVHYRLSYDSEAVTTEIESPWPGIDELTVRGSSAMVATLTTGAHSFTHDLRQAGGWAFVSLLVGGRSWIETHSGYSFPVDISQDGYEWTETFHEDQFSRVHLPYVSDQLSQPLSAELEFSWTGLIRDAGSWEYEIFGNGHVIYGALSFSANSITARVIDPAETPAPIPLPAGLPLMAAGLGALAVLRRRSRG